MQLKHRDTMHMTGRVGSRIKYILNVNLILCKTSNLQSGLEYNLTAAQFLLLWRRFP